MASILYQIKRAERKRMIEPSFFFPLTKDLSFSTIDQYLKDCLDLEDNKAADNINKIEPKAKDLLSSPEVFGNSSSAANHTNDNSPDNNNSKKIISIFSSPLNKAERLENEVNYYSSSKKKKIELSPSPILGCKSQEKQSELFKDITQFENEETGENINSYFNKKKTLFSEKRITGNIDYELDQENFYNVSQKNNLESQFMDIKKTQKKRRLQFWNTDMKGVEQLRKKIRI